MNATFLGSGVRVLLAGLVLAPFVPRRGRWAVLPLVVAYAAGLVIIALFPSATSGLRVTMHGIGAYLAIVGGTVLLLAVAIAVARRHPVVATFTGVCAVVSAVGTWFGVSGTDHFGFYERIAVYAVVLWQAVMGAVLLTTASPSVGVRQGE